MANTTVFYDAGRHFLRFGQKAKVVLNTFARMDPFKKKKIIFLFFIIYFLNDYVLFLML